MSSIPLFPAFLPLQPEMKNELFPIFATLQDGISEFVFASIILHRNKYAYKVSKTSQGIYILSRSYKGDSGFIILNGLPEKEQLLSLFADYKKALLVSESLFEKYGDTIKSWGISIEEDRNNFDYLYNRSDLALLAGKKFHKKKNLVNAFEAAYTPQVKVLDEQTRADAQFILEKWNEKHSTVTTDYEIALEALQNIDNFGLQGWVVYADDKPCAWTLGEYLCNGTMFCVHFEKGIDDYKGVYQYVNRACASSLPETVQHINREQDLGDEGLRQAKLTYRPSGFVKKYIATIL